MQVRCPNCGQLLSVTDEQRNIQLACPICQRRFVISGTATMPPAAFPPAPGPKSSNKPLLFALLGAGLALLTFLVIVVIGVLVVMWADDDDSGDSLRANENRFYMSQAFVVGDYVRNKLGGGKILVIADPSYKQDTRMGDFVAAMQKGLGGEVAVDTVNLPKQTYEKMAEPISERMTARDFEAVVARHGDAKVIVSLIDLPHDIGKHPELLQNCKAGKGPKIILIGGDVPQLAQMIGAGLVTAAVAVSPKAKFSEDPAPADEKAAFAVRYLLVDKSNIAENRGLFGN